MTYQPNIPTGSVPLDQDYNNLKTNFQQLDTRFGRDHVPFSTTGSNPLSGYHQSIHFNPASTPTGPLAPNNYVQATQFPQGVPATVAGIGQLFSSQVNDGTGSPDTGLYWLTGAGKKVAFTRNFQPVLSANGCTFLPGGLILQWGTQLTTTSGAGTPVTWPKPFTTVFSAQLTCTTSATNNVRVASFLGALTNTGATIFVTNENNSLRAENVFFYVIGI